MKGFLRSRGVDERRIEEVLGSAPEESPQWKRTRREFLRDLAAGGGLVLGLSFTDFVRAEKVDGDGKVPSDFRPNAFIQITPDGRTTIYGKHSEMGQGIHTGLAIAICEELEIDVADVTVVPAPGGPEYGNSAYQIQVTGGSTSTWSSFDQMRNAGAVARSMLVAAAASEWKIDVAECVAENGTVRTKDGAKSATYGELAIPAAKQSVPDGVTLKSKSEWIQIGKPTARVDSASKVRGTAIFSLDQRRPGMLTAMVARSPYFGGTVKSFDATKATEVSGVKKVVQIPQGVAVIATGYWAARKGREVLEVEWDAGPGGDLDSKRLFDDYVKKSALPGMVSRDDGDFDAAFGAAAVQHEAVYEIPFMAHAPMEPLSCMVELRKDGGCDVVTGSQMIGADRPAVAAKLGCDIEKVRFTNSYLGGGFGRRANPASDFTMEALEVALASKDLDAPIKVVWDRADDLAGGWYRPMYVSRVTAGLGGGEIQAWRHRVVGQSIAQGTPFEPLMVHNGVDELSVEGAKDLPYGVPNLRVELHTVSLPVPILWWRSVGHSHTAFAKECFLDECAEKLGRDPYTMRREMLKDHPRWRRVLDLAAEKAGWGRRQLPEGHGMGIAVHESFKGFAAHVVEASVEDGKPKIHRVVCAIDCGLAVNPDQVRAQMEGAVNFALSATLGSEITFEKGRVVQENFDTFQVVRMHEAPKIEVHIVDSDDAMGGIGEVGIPPVAAATCSALAAATGKRIRKLPVAGQYA